MSDRIVLGIHGNVISRAVVHDTSAAIVKNGKVVAAVSEERLSRKKMDGAFPDKAIREVMDLAGVAAKDIDVVAVGMLHPEDGAKKFLKSVRSTYMDTGVFLRKKFSLFAKSIINHKRHTSREQFFELDGVNIPVEFVEHHLCHVAGAFYCSPFEEALVITLDGGGDGLDGSVYMGKGDRLELLFEVPHYQSPGTMYSGLTHDLGFKRLRHEGKITGLAAYGNPDPDEIGLGGLIHYDSKKHRFVSKLVAKHHKDINSNSPYFGPLLETTSKEDLAAVVQELFERSIVEYAQDALAQAKKKGHDVSRVCMAGGCFANVKMNQRILEIDGVDNVFVFPAMGDGGLSAGAGLESNYKVGKAKRMESELDDVYLGRGYTNDDIESALKKANLSYEKFDNVEERIGKILAEGKIVARFNGRMEYGPRALGNRSILGAPFDSTINDWLNKKLNRTEFMPFAPSMLAELAPEYLEGYSKDHIAAEFMTITYDMKEGVKDKMPAVVHVDNTARPQVVFSHKNPSYHAIISSFHKHTGIGVVLNTSFNIHEEPIVNSPEEAIKGFLQAELDYLGIGSFIVAHPEGRNK